MHGKCWFCNDTATSEIYTTRHTLSLHDALPISSRVREPFAERDLGVEVSDRAVDRSEEHTSELQSRLVNSYAVFCLQTKKKLTLPIIVYRWSVGKTNGNDIQAL